MAGQNPFAQLFNYHTFHLAVLEPSTSEEAPVKVSLSSSNRTDTPYECISYDRSQDYGSAKIILDDTEIEIPKPLETALRALRKKNQSRLLWADVLLGRTLQEQNAQAALARTILQNSSCTIAWLGSGSGRTQEAFKKIMTLAIWWHQASLAAGHSGPTTKLTTTHMNTIMLEIMKHNVAELQPSDQPLWDAMTSVFTAGYFNSVQSIPDIILSKETLITSGLGSITWHDFIAAYHALVIVIPRLLNKAHPPSITDGFSRVAQIEIAERRYREDPGLELLPMIQTARDMKCADIREYVFSMLPITRPSKRTEDTGIIEPPLIVDYTKSEEEVFTEAAKYAIHERQDVLLWWAERPSHARKLQNLPSWVPDWTQALPMHIVKLFPEGPLAQWTYSIPDRKRLRVEGNTLHVQAHILDHITYVSEIFTEENRFRLLLEQWQNLPIIEGQTLEAKVHRFWRTIILNVGGIGESLRDQPPPPKELWTSFQSCIAEERLMQLLNCTRQQFMESQELQERARADETCFLLAQQCGHSEQFDALFLRNSLGRRFFTTENGRIGMSTFEELHVAENNETTPSALSTPNTARLPSDPLTEMMLSGFQTYLAQRDPRAAELMGNFLEQREKKRGIKSGDVVAAIVGGFHPYVLRPIAIEESDTNDSSNKYRFVGDCYLHGVMNGECFGFKKSDGHMLWRTVNVEDIEIV